MFVWFLDFLVPGVYNPYIFCEQLGDTALFLKN